MIFEIINTFKNTNLDLTSYLFNSAIIFLGVLYFCNLFNKNEK